MKGKKKYTYPKKKRQEETNNGAMNFNEWCTLFLGGHIKENVV